MALTGKVGKEFTLTPAGVHVARCTKVVDIGTQTKNGKSNRKIMIAFELPNSIQSDGDYAGEPFGASGWYNLFMSPQAFLRVDLESWRGVQFTTEQAEAFDILKLVGVPAFLNIVHEESNGKTYANIKAIMPLPDGTTCPPAVNECYGFSLEPEDFNVETFGKLTENMQSKIKETPEWAALHKKEEPPQDTGQQSGGYDPNDDVPF